MELRQVLFPLSEENNKNLPHTRRFVLLNEAFNPITFSPWNTGPITSSL